MISIGAHYSGPELEGSRINELIRAAMISVESARGKGYEAHSSPAVNVVFYVPGSLGGFEIPRIEASRFSRKKKLVLVAVPVPPEVAQAGGSVEFVVDALHKAVAIAAEVFAGKGAEPLDLAKAETILEKVRQALLAQAW
jgi:hypothetical protein